MRFFGSSELILFSITLFQIVKGINTHYDTLDVTKAANIGEIRSQYLKLVKQYHPDVNKSPEAQGKFVKIQTAWEVLKEPIAKNKYDRSLLAQRNNKQHSPRGASRNRNENGYENSYQHQAFTFTTNSNENKDSFFQFNVNLDSFFKPNPNNFQSTQLLFESDRNTIGLSYFNFQQHFLNSVKSTVTICIAYSYSLESRALSRIWERLTEKYAKYGVKFFAFNIEQKPDLMNYFQITGNGVPQIFSLIETNENNNKYNKILFKDLDMSDTKAHFFQKFDDYIRSLFEKNNKITLINNNKEFNIVKNNPTLKFRPSVLLVINNNNNNNNDNNNNDNRQKKIPLFYYYFSLKYYRNLDFYLIKDSSILKSQLPNNNENFFLTIFNDKFNNFNTNINNKANNNNHGNTLWYTINNAENNIHLIESTILQNKQMTVTRISGEETFSSICKTKDKYCVLWFTEMDSKNFKNDLIKYKDFARNTSTVLEKPVNFGFLHTPTQKEFCSQFMKNFKNKIIILNVMGNGLMRYIILDSLSQLRSIKNGNKFPISSQYRRIQLKEEIFYTEKSNFNWFLYLIIPSFLFLISYLNWVKKFFSII
ncbi:DNAj [Anaeramoeba flamelloides]|uniref:DNAj n=1 Tax=Anaeramoeba flamelloides TaxID=1746091 RepID=A0ABQ8Z1L7_9EUKA|nr:DNAj [Anaeramoeba flamelloides]